MDEVDGGAAGCYVPPTLIKATLPENLRVLVDEYSELVGLSRGAIVRIALAEYFIGRKAVGIHGTSSTI